MNFFLPFISLILLGCIYAGSLKTPKERLTVVVVVLLFILFLCYMQNGKLELFTGGYAPLEYTMKNGREGCDGYNYNDINSQIGPIGTYDGLVLKSKIVTKPLVNPYIFTPTGDAVLLTEDPASQFFPTVDGLKDSPKHLFTFANNQRSWECCGSSNITSDMNGCVCYSPEQLKMFGHRAGNLTEPIEYPGV